MIERSIFIRLLNGRTLANRAETRCTFSLAANSTPPRKESDTRNGVWCEPGNSLAGNIGENDRRENPIRVCSWFAGSLRTEKACPPGSPTPANAPEGILSVFHSYLTKVSSRRKCDTPGTRQGEVATYDTTKGSPQSAYTGSPVPHPRRYVSAHLL